MHAVTWLGVLVVACGGKVEPAPARLVSPDVLCAGTPPLEPRTVLDGPVYAFAVSPSGFYWGTRDSFGWKPIQDGSPVVEATDRFNIDDAAADDGGGYFTSLGYPTPSGQITRSQPGGRVDILANGLVNPAAIAVDEHDIYFVDSGIPSMSDSAGKIWKLSKSGGAPDLFVDGLSYPKEIAAAGSQLYWVDVGQRAIGRADKTTGAVEILFQSPDGITDFALVDGAAYWVNERSLNRLDLETRQNQRLTDGLYDRDGVSDWPEVEANGSAVFVSAAMPEKPSSLGLYMLTPSDAAPNPDLVELDRDVGQRLVVTSQAVFYAKVTPDGQNHLAMICLP